MTIKQSTPYNASTLGGHGTPQLASLYRLRSLQCSTSPNVSHRGRQRRHRGNKTIAGGCYTLTDTWTFRQEGPREITLKASLKPKPVKLQYKHAECNGSGSNNEWQLCFLSFSTPCQLIGCWLVMISTSVRLRNFSASSFRHGPFSKHLWHRTRICDLWF